jgi:chromosomal replication initiator protein
MSKDNRGKKSATAREAAERSKTGAAEPLVVVKENRFAHAAISQLAQPPAGDSVGLVYLYGPSGVGKSHFVRHFIREVRRQTPRLRLVTETASEFVANLSVAFLHEGQAEFATERSAIDLLVLEDLAAIQGRSPAQRMLVLILDDLKRSGARVIVTCTCLPGQLKGMIPRLASRLRGGLCVPLELLDEPSRLTFAKHLAASRQIPLSAEAAEVLARKGPATPREILAALINLDLGSRHNGRNSDASLVEAQLNAGKSPQDRSLARIAKAVADFYGVPLGQLRSTARLKRTVLARQVAMLLARELSGQSAAVIARFFGRKNHTTVVHACRRTRTLLATDLSLASDVERLRRALRRG